MERSDSISSNGSGSTSNNRVGSSAAPFGYQQRLLERTSSRSNTGSLSRSSSQQRNFFGTVSGGAPPPSSLTGAGGAGPSSVRRWTPSHRPANSLDTVRGKWEQRAKQEAAELDDGKSVLDSPTRETLPELNRRQSVDDARPMTPDEQVSSSELTEHHRTPPLLKRHTFSTPINTPSPAKVGSFDDRPSSPTKSLYGNTHTTPTPASATGTRRFFPPKSYTSSVIPGTTSTTTTPTGNGSPSRTPLDPAPTYLPRTRRSTTTEGLVPDLTGSSTTSDGSSVSSQHAPYTPVSSAGTVRRRPLSMYGTSTSTSTAATSSYTSPYSLTTTPTSASATATNSNSFSRPQSPDKAYTYSRPSSSLDYSRPGSSLSTVTPTPVPVPAPAPAPSSVMTPASYRSQGIAGKKDRSNKYGDDLVVGRRLGRHLPRIASGDAGDDWVADEPPSHSVPAAMPSPVAESRFEDQAMATPTRPSAREQREIREMRERRMSALEQLESNKNVNVTPSKPLASPAFGSVLGSGSASGLGSGTGSVRTHRRPLSMSAVPASPGSGSATGAAGGEVTGVAGRLRFSRDIATSVTSTQLPLSAIPASSKVSRTTSRWGLWADTQRHLLQAYEYLCHVGEAQQWIEGCLGEELGFGVVEMDEGLRNGVVLAKLVRGFRGDGSVRRIYEAPKLDFRHSENINVFFVFVREVGLPEGFIFELTDLYDKKNIPKVIYCIHALSHLLVRRGMAERMGNLLGQLEFSNDQLERTNRGLKDAGVAMPNFKGVGRELAIEINEEPEEEPESEDDRIQRQLLENEDSIVAVQTFARAFLVRKALATQRVRLRFAERDIPKLQAICRGALARRLLGAQRQEQHDLTPWAVALQKLARGRLARAAWLARLRRIKTVRSIATKVQAQARGVLVRRRFAMLKAAVRRTMPAVVKLQSIARARMARKVHHETVKAVSEPLRLAGIVGLQAHMRGALQRRRMAALFKALHRVEPYVVHLQAQTKGMLMRRRMRTQLAKLEDVTSIVIRIQAAVRTYLARKRLLGLIRGLRKATPTLIGLQARARANLARQHHATMAKALSQVQVITAVGGLQALARAAIMRNRHREQSKELDFVQPDVLGIQAACRGALVRRDFYAWRDHLWQSQPAATMLQALLRGVLQRRKFRERMKYYRSNLDKVIKIQSLFRAKETREQYRQLTLGTNVNVGTIKNFVHLLDDSEADFQEEVQIERLRKRVVEAIRENQALEADVADLDVKIALVVQNVKSFEELIRARRRHGADTAATHAARASLLAAHGDPFAGPSTLDRDAKRKLELYQQLFYLLQTKGEYLSRLFIIMAAESGQETSRRLVERVSLTLFGYGQDRREDYLLLKLFQMAIGEEIGSAPSTQAITTGHPAYIGVATQYIRPRQTAYVREALQTVIRDVIDAEDLDLEVDPSVIYRSRMELEEMRSGVASGQPMDLPFREALKDGVTRAEYIRHLQILQLWTEAFVLAVVSSTKKMPYSMRYLARETLLAVQSRFPDAPQHIWAACVGRLVYYRYINPAIVTPETFDIVPSTIDVSSRKNLAQISRVLTQITTGTEFSENAPCYIPINDYVRKAIEQLGSWFIEVATVPDAETEYHAHEFMDATVQPKPIYITPNEVYATQGLLSEHLQHLAPDRDDPLSLILHELGGVPNLSSGSDELHDARDLAVTLELTNRFANVRDPRAEEKTLWVQAKRGVLAILRVQPAKDLVEALMKPVSPEHQAMWEEIIQNEAIMDHQRNRRMPSTAGAEYRLEDIRELPFNEVKAHAIYYLLELEKLGKITREDGYQGILNAIAGDVRSKHRKRIQRQQERDSMQQALRSLGDRKKNYEEQIKSYNDYVEGAMKTMQKSGKGWKRFTMPFTKQYFHLRDLQKTGKLPQFGSFKYSAHDLYDKGILLSIDQFSPRQFDKIDIVISSNQVGVFSMEMFNNSLGITNRMATTDLRMEDLLQAQFENKASLSIFNNMAKANLTALLLHINKKFYI